MSFSFGYLRDFSLSLVFSGLTIVCVGSGFVCPTPVSFQTLMCTNLSIKIQICLNRSVVQLSFCISNKLSGEGSVGKVLEHCQGWENHSPAIYLAQFLIVLSLVVKFIPWGVTTLPHF